MRRISPRRWKDRGPFTVFAPTDAAFAKLPAGTVETLLKPENRDRLAAILTYHVVPGKVMASEVTKLDEAKTVNGRMIDVSTSGGTVMVNDAKVITADIPASNGIIHVIDTVILPPRGWHEATPGRQSRFGETCRKSFSCK
jgi:uncharacterized surface protein with fasciclin (FAS1) repeats